MFIKPFFLVNKKKGKNANIKSKIKKKKSFVRKKKKKRKMFLTRFFFLIGKKYDIKAQTPKQQQQEKQKNASHLVPKAEKVNSFVCLKPQIWS